MTQYSHSKVETFENCPYRYKLRYIDRLDTLANDDPTNALFLGSALHTGIEKGVDAGIQAYFDSYPIISDEHINEALKLAHFIPKVQAIINSQTKSPIFEQELNCPDLIGFIDLLMPLKQEGLYKEYALYDFKYSNNADRYLQSRQLHEYKYFFEKLNPYSKIVSMGYIFIPKTQIRQKKTEDLFQFRARLNETLARMEIQVVHVEYDPNKVIEFYQQIKTINENACFEKNESKLCNFCDYKNYCQQGETYMLLPKNERRIIDASSRKKIWIYGSPFSGKTTLANAFPDPLFLNTDGNLSSFDAPYVEIKDTLEGRQTVTAWENFEKVIDELAKGSDFKTIIVDLLEDTYEHCRQFMYKEMGIAHESDSNFKAWDMVLSRFLATIKKLSTMDYNIVFISHEDMTKDITKKSGDKITAIKPNLREKVATKVSGMVDIVARVVCDDEQRSLQFKSDDVVFGGGRLKLNKTVVPLTYEALDNVYKNQVVAKSETTEQPSEDVTEESPQPVQVEEQPTRRTRTRKGE